VFTTAPLINKYNLLTTSKALEQSSALREKTRRVKWIKKNPKAFEQMEWISKNGTKYSNPKKMISAFEKHFKING